MNTRIVQIHGFRGSFQERFPQIGLLGKGGKSIVTIEMPTREMVCAAAGLNPEDDLETLQEQGLEASCWAIVTLSHRDNRTATEEEILNPATSGAYEAPNSTAENPVWLVKLQTPLEIWVVDSAYNTAAKARAACIDNEAIEAFDKNLALRTSGIKTTKDNLAAIEAILSGEDEEETTGANANQPKAATATK